MGELQLQPIYSRLDSEWSPSLLQSHPLERIQTKEEFLSKGNILDGSRNPRDDEFQCDRTWKQFNSTESNKHCSQERFRSIPFYSRSEKGQSGNKRQLFQNGQHSEMSKVCSERYVGNENRSKERLFPRTNQEGTLQTPWIQIQESNLSIQMPSIWSESSPQKLHQNNERIGDQVEETRYPSIHIYRRHLDSQQQQRNNSTTHRYSYERSGNFGMDYSEREKCIDSLSMHRISRSGTGSSVRSCENSIQQTSNSTEYNSRTLVSEPIEQVCSMQESCTIPRKDGISNSFKPLLCSISRPSSKGYGESSKQQILACINENIQRCNKRPQHFENSDSGKQWNSLRTKFNTPNSGKFRCLPNRFWDTRRINHYNWKIHFLRAHQCERIKNTPHFLHTSRSIKPLWSWTSIRDKRRQCNSNILYKERLRNRRKSISDCQRSLQDPDEKKMVDFESDLHSLQGEQSGRQTESSNRMEIISRTTESSSDRIWRTPCGQIRNSRINHNNPIQLVDRERHIPESMGTKPNELLCSSSGSDISSSSSLHKVRSQSDLCSSRLALFDMVSSLAKDIRKNGTCFPKDAYNNALVRITRQVRNFEFPGCSSAWQVIQAIRDLSILSSIAEKTFRCYNRVYGGFLWFINVFDLTINDPTAIEYYISYLLVNVQGYKAKTVQAAIQFFANLESRPVTISASYTQVKRGVLKLYTLSDRVPLQRDPITVKHLADYIKCKDKVNNFTFCLTSAILVIGFRLFARPGEVARLKWSYINVLKNGKIRIDLSGHKTDFFLIEKPITIDKNSKNPSLCPIKLLNSYMDLVRDFKDDDSPLFSYENNKFLDSNGISKILKDAVGMVDQNVVVSGHSLRIGAITEGLRKGVSTEDLMVGARHKKAKSLFPYLRSEGLAGKKFSNTILSLD